VEKIQQAPGTFHGVLINPAAFTHTSIAIRDALSMLNMLMIEIHLTNIYKRETFRHVSMISDVVMGQISGFGHHGYLLALDGLAQMLSSS
jgi:3-dehydroquinate dehydratase-2